MITILPSPAEEIKANESKITDRDIELSCTKHLFLDPEYLPQLEDVYRKILNFSEN